MQIPRQRRERRVIGQALEKFRDIRDPEGPLEPGADFVKSLGKAQDCLSCGAGTLARPAYAASESEDCTSVCTIR